jgi:hypothetical protein
MTLGGRFQPDGTLGANVNYDAYLQCATEGCRYALAGGLV